MISMLFYLGYLTIVGEKLGRTELKIPNKVIEDLYVAYFLESVEKELDYRISENSYEIMLEELSYNGKIDKVVETLKTYLSNLSN